MANSSKKVTNRDILYLSFILLLLPTLKVECVAYHTKELMNYHILPCAF